jgi:ribosomal protein S18
MASCRLLSSQFLSQLSRLSLQQSSRSSLPQTLATTGTLSSNTTVVRFFSDKDKNKNAGGKSAQSEDPFGIHFDDGTDQGRIGPEGHLPPKYKRDPATGHLTGDIERELTEEEKRILKADPLEREKLLIRRVERHWSKEGMDKGDQPVPLDKLGRGVRETDMGTNVLGRSVQSQASEEQLEDGSHLGRDDTGFSQPLTKKEFGAFSQYMKKEHKTDVTEDDIPVQDSHSGSTTQPGDDPDDLDLSLKWLTARAQRQMDDSVDDNPFSDLLPGDLSPTRLVNRKRAKLIPSELLHHNNIELLQRFMTPTGQIRNRVQTRLGARDQRRVAKLVKRARALGLMPYSGQFKAEQHGWIHAKDMAEDKGWERELEKRGLVIKRSPDDKSKE